jgi:hypothetical protein
MKVACVAVDLMLSIDAVIMRGREMGVVTQFSVKFLLILAVAGCAESTTSRLSQNTIRIDVSAARVCGKAGTLRLVNKMAAVETIRLGYDRYIIVDSALQDNVRVVGYNAETFGTYGGGFFNAQTYTNPIIRGSRDAAIIVQMFKSGDPQGRQAIDARQSLGAEWKAIVEKGAPTTCY